MLEDLPEVLPNPGLARPDPLAAACNQAVGAEIVAVTNQRFARVANIFSESVARWDASAFGRDGKIMDS